MGCSEREWSQQAGRTGSPWLAGNRTVRATEVGRAIGGAGRANGDSKGRKGSSERTELERAARADRAGVGLGNGNGNGNGLDGWRLNECSGRDRAREFGLMSGPGTHWLLVALAPN